MTDLQEPFSRRPVALLRGAVKRYGDVTALDGVDLELRPGEVLGLLGPNGAGKTTLVNLLLGLARPDEGETMLFGHRPWDLRARVRTGAMLQISGVPETLKVREHVQLVSSYYPRPLELDRALGLAGLEAIAERRFGELSGGQRQRLLFALAICGRPELLFLDEPTVGLDVEARRGLWRCIGELASAGCTVLLTTHYLEEAEHLASRVAVIHRGRLVAEGSPAEVEARAGGRRVRCKTRLEPSRLAGWPEVDEMRVEARRSGEGDVRVELLTRRAEEVVRRLLDLDPDLTELEVHAAGLEEALLALTRDDEPRQEAA